MSLSSPDDELAGQPQELQYKEKTDRTPILTINNICKKICVTRKDGCMVLQLFKETFHTEHCVYILT